MVQWEHLNLPERVGRFHGVGVGLLAYAEICGNIMCGGLERSGPHSRQYQDQT